MCCTSWQVWPVGEERRELWGQGERGGGGRGQREKGYCHDAAGNPGIPGPHLPHVAAPLLLLLPHG